MPPEASEASDATLPAAFGKYFLTEKLATGGMAEIYLAKLIGPSGFEKSLVIKQIHPRLSGQRPFVDLFVAEAKILVTLAHGNIVPVYELGVVDDVYFIAMEYIDGPTLYRLTEAIARRDGVMAPPVAAWIAARVLEGLDYAHRKGEGVIHRDLSPRNVMMSRDGEVKLVDFGIALTADSAADGGGDAPTGSFPYMSPEQVRREALTAQTDLFSVGVLLWEMLAGRRLFARPDAEATLAAVEGAEIERPSVLRPDVPARLDEVVMRALERDRGARYASAGDMLAALQRYLYALDETPGPRDVAALVARYCPPETRRLATHAEAMALGAAEDGRAGTASDGRDGPDGPDGRAPRAAADRHDEQAAGPRTAVLPRPAPAGVPSTPTLPAPRGRRSCAPTRQQSFATHVALDEMLGSPVAASDAAPGATSGDAAAGGAVKDGAPARIAPARVREANEPPSREEMAAYRAGAAPGRSGLVFGALGALALGFGAFYVFARGRSAVMAPDATLERDAGDLVVGHPDASLADVAAPIDARGPAATPADAAAPAPPSDAAAARHPSSGAPDAAIAIAAPVDARSPSPSGTATLKLGADPWGDIEVDGAPRGHTPAELTVSAGHHAVQIIYRGDDPPQTKTFAVDLGAGEIKSLQASFAPH